MQFRNLRRPPQGLLEGGNRRGEIAAAHRLTPLGHPLRELGRVRGAWGVHRAILSSQAEYG